MATHSLPLSPQDRPHRTRRTGETSDRTTAKVVITLRRDDRIKCRRHSRQRSPQIEDPRKIDCKVPRLLRVLDVTERPPLVVRGKRACSHVSPRGLVAAPPADTATGRVTIAITDKSPALAAPPDHWKSSCHCRTGRSISFKRRKKTGGRVSSEANGPANTQTAPNSQSHSDRIESQRSHCACRVPLRTRPPPIERRLQEPSSDWVHANVIDHAQQCPGFLNTQIDAELDSCRVDTLCQPLAHSCLGKKW